MNTEPTKENFENQDYETAQTNNLNRLSPEQRAIEQQRIDALTPEQKAQSKRDWEGMTPDERKQWDSQHIGLRWIGPGYVLQSQVLSDHPTTEHRERARIQAGNQWPEEAQRHDEAVKNS
jgi:hypothetical protein